MLENVMALSAGRQLMTSPLQAEDASHVAQLQFWAAAKLMAASCRGSLVHRQLFLGIYLLITRELTIPSLSFLDSFSLLTDIREEQCQKRLILGSAGQSCFAHDPGHACSMHKATA